jgi:hypothetical protein
MLHCNDHGITIICDAAFNSNHKVQFPTIITVFALVLHDTFRPGYKQVAIVIGNRRESQPILLVTG